MYKVIEGKKGLKEEQLKKKKEKLHTIYEIGFFRTFYENECESIDDLKRAVWYCAKMLITERWDTKTSSIDFRNFIEYCSLLKSQMSKLTYREFMNIFPVDKYYDKTKSCKDYYSTMECIKALQVELDDIIDENIYTLLMEYGNRDIISLQVKEFMAVDKLRKEQGKMSMAEEFIHKYMPELPTYTIYEKEGYIYNQKTGKTSKLVKPKKTSKTLKRIK